MRPIASSIGWVWCRAVRRVVTARSRPAAPGRGAGARTSIPTRSATRAGQSIQPVFEGWEKNADGTFSMWFGYLNRNYEERLNIPVGAEQRLQRRRHGPGRGVRAAALALRVQGRRARRTSRRTAIWSGRVTANGVTQKAFGSLWPVWEVDQGTISANRGSRTAIDFDEPPNAAPRVVNPPPKQTVEAGKPLTLTLSVEDDGNPQPRVDRGAQRRRAEGRKPAERPLNDSLRVSWVQWRGPGHRDLRAQGGPRRRRQGDDEGHLRQARLVRAARLRRGREHPHAARRQRDGRRPLPASADRAAALGPPAARAGPALRPHAIFPE